MKYTTLVAAIIISLSFASCGSDDITIDEVRGRIFEGTAANGLEDCGWFIEINEEKFIPNFLSSQFRVDGLVVLLKVEFLNESADCGQLATVPERLRIEQIRITQ